VKIDGLDKNGIKIILEFMKSKLNDETYINAIESGGNECEMSWMENMNISNDDMIHELFEIYGKNLNDVYVLEIDNYKFITSKYGEDWSERYEYNIK
jgi:hypothetical protein